MKINMDNVVEQILIYFISIVAWEMFKSNSISLEDMHKVLDKINEEKMRQRRD